MRTLPTIILALTLASCATAPGPGPGRYHLSQPIVDTDNMPEGRNYSQDLRECQQHAAKVKGAGRNALDSGLFGAGLGAVVGAAVGAAFGVDVGRNAALGAATGGFSGAAGGATQSVRSKALVMKQCMSNRGYSVLN